MKFKLFALILAFAAAMPLAARAEYVLTDSVDRSARTDSLAPLHGNWVQQLIQTNFHINDPRIRYPRFANFCRKVYNWGDHTFNTYDKNYVVGTGKNWKLYLNSYNWAQSYGYIFDLSNRNDNVLIRSDINSDFGFKLSFMAVSIGYSWNVNQWITGNSAPRKTFNFEFNCSLFSAELMQNETSGNAHIERFGSWNDGRRVNIPLDDVHQKITSVSAYYFFNHSRYSQSAAYAFSKYQLRSAGSWILGAHWSQQHITMDFSSLPDEILQCAPNLPRINTFNFTDYNLMGGYAYNWSLPHNWIINITALPSVGYRRSKLRSSNRAIQQMISANMRLRCAFTYNYRALFLSLYGRFDGGFVFDSNYSFFNSTQSVSLLCGIRF